MISLIKVSKNYGFVDILHDFSLTINDGEKVGLIGKNGSGKTTVLKLIAGLVKPDLGTVSISKDYTVGYMQQSLAYHKGETVLDKLTAVFSRLLEMEEKLKSLEEKMGSGGLQQIEMNKLIKQYTRLSSRFEHAGGYSYHTNIAQVMEGLGISKFSGSLVDKLSGGEQGKVQLAEILLQKPDVLLLDEPTNHLDFTALGWLEEYIKNYRGTVLVVSHDRYFLDHTIKRIIEIKNGQASDYAGNFTYYLKERKVRFEQELREYNNQQKEIKRKEEMISRLKRWGDENDNPKFHRKAASAEKQLAKMEKKERPELGDSRFNLNFASERSGREVARLRKVTKSFSGLKVLTDVDLDIYYQQRLGLVGPNGSGKSTLLNIILGNILPDSGEVSLGSSINMGYLAQQPELSTTELTILEEFRRSLPMPEARARKILASYGFAGELVFKYINEMSGGERVRYQLMKMVYSEVNFLIMDEPTNHLDLASIEILEEALQEYSGTLLVVSHDRFFLNKIVDGIYALEDKALFYYDGNIDYYRKKRKEQEEQQKKREAAAERKLQSKIKNPRNDKREQVTKEKELQKIIKEIEDEVSLIEARIQENNQQMAKPENLADYEYLHKLKEENRSLHVHLENLLSRWEGEISKIEVDE